MTEEEAAALGEWAYQFRRKTAQAKALKEWIALSVENPRNFTVANEYGFSEEFSQKLATIIRPHVEAEIERIKAEVASMSVLPPNMSSGGGRREFL